VVFRDALEPAPGGTKFAPNQTSTARAGQAEGQSLHTGVKRRGHSSGVQDLGETAERTVPAEPLSLRLAAIEVIEINGICNYCLGTKLV
jgi:hypothetical protein